MSNPEMLFVSEDADDMSTELTGAFDTFRLGSKWADALLPGDKVDLVHCPFVGNEDASLRTRMGEAVVSAVEVLALDEALAPHSWDNHAMVSREPEWRHEAASWLRDVRASIYGDANAGPETEFTVVSLVRI